MKKLVTALIWPIVFSVSSLSESASAETQTICPRLDLLLLSPRDEISFNETEKLLICGDPSTAAWSKIPASQAFFHLRGFLQTRGYLQPKLIETAQHPRQDHLTVRVGPLTRWGGLQVKGVPPGVILNQFWVARSEPLTPEVLDRVEKWLKAQLASQGYPCAKLDTVANADSGFVTVSIRPVRFQRLVAIRESSVDQSGAFNAKLLRRYDPFELGDPYDGRLLELSSRRVGASSVVLSSYWETECRSDGAAITRKIAAGEPHLVSFGIGFDSERLALMTASWQNSRLGSYASSLSAKAELSYPEQSAVIANDWYPSPRSFFIRSSFGFTRSYERKYEERKVEASSRPAIALDWASARWEGLLGPAYRHIYTIRGKRRGLVRFASMDFTLRTESHAYSYYLSDPQTGFAQELNYIHADKGFSSDIAARVWRWRGQRLWNLGDYDPARFVLGLRGGFATTIDLARGESDSLIPESFRQQIGGSTDLRGFARRRLPPSQPAMTTAFMGSELLLKQWLPWGLEPLVLVDLGGFSYESLHLERTVLWSHGGGARWRSPIGNFRATVAKGHVEGKRHSEWAHLAGWQLFVSYGENF